MVQLQPETYRGTIAIFDRPIEPDAQGLLKADANVIDVLRKVRDAIVSILGIDRAPRKRGASVGRKNHKNQGVNSTRVSPELAISPPF